MLQTQWVVLFWSETDRLCVFFQETQDPSAVLWLDEIQNAILMSNKDTQEALQCKNSTHPSCPTTTFFSGLQADLVHIVSVFFQIHFIDCLKCQMGKLSTCGTIGSIVSGNLNQTQLRYLKEHILFEHRFGSKLFLVVSRA